MSETVLSQEAYDKLKAELEELKTVGRKQVSQEIEIARQHGDLRENAEYHAAKDKQGHMEARIRQLEALLRNAKVGVPEEAGDEVKAGLVVTVSIEGDEETFLLGSREDSHDTYDILSTSSPIGRAVLGAKVGETVQAETPGGALDIEVKSLQTP